jgi:hypothetical protein
VNDSRNKFVGGKPQPEPGDHRSADSRFRAASAPAVKKKQPAASVPKGPGGERLDPKTATLRDAAYASRRAGSPADTVPVRLPAIDVEALGKSVAEWRRNTREGQAFHTGDPETDRYNAEVLNQAIQHHLKVGWPVNVTLIAGSYQWALGNNHFDLRRRDADGNIFSPRGLTSKTPTPLARCIWPDEEEQVRQQEINHAISTRLSEEAQLKKLSTEELRKLATQDRKHPRAGQPGCGGIL